VKTEYFGSLERKTIIFAVIVTSAVILTGRLFQMQILHRSDYDIKSSDNSIKSMELAPLRGIFYDRNYKVLVSNVPSYTFRITPAYYDTSLNKIIETVIGAEPGFVRNLLEQNKIYSKYLPIRTRRKIDFPAVAWFEEHSEHLPGVDYIIEMQRYYPAGIMSSHIFGYSKEIPPEQLAKEGSNYSLGDYVGHTGLEKNYEKILRGRRGFEFVLVDSRRKQIAKYLGGSEDILPVKGNDLVLGIEASAQRVAEEEFKGKRGALVAIDPSSGEIIAMVSSPDYDLTQFSFLTPKDFLQRVYNDPGKPLFNRATMSVNPPGSTIKMLEALTALDLGIINTSHTVYCTGGFTYGRFFKCHGTHGRMNVTSAIEKSCNTFFYKLIYDIGLDNWHDYAKRFGFGQKTNIDITEEAAGFIPDENFYIKKYGVKWPKSIMASLGIGQGEVSVTPLQLAQYVALIANNGKMKTPHIVRGYIDNETEKLVPFQYGEIDTKISQKAFDIVKEAMFLVVNGKGTATHIRLPDIEIAGKTGTAQNPHGEDHAWFVGFAPYENPKIALAVIVENVGFGGTHAAPIAKKVIKTYIDSFKGEGRAFTDEIASISSNNR
jgi:penicillin-binding protein 2